jgi:Protein of unknown function (DUF2934)
MTWHLEERTRYRAFQIWERQGKSGDPVEHWIQAEHELRREAGECLPQRFTEFSPERCAEAINDAIEKLTRRARLRARGPSSCVRQEPQQPS